MLRSGLRAAMLSGVVATALSAAVPAVAYVPVGNHNTLNCGPFACMAGGGFSLYQQVYSADAFSAPEAIDTISFFKGVSGPMDSATYAISFYLSPFGPQELTLDAAANKGALLSSFGTFSLAGELPDILTFNGSGFTYDPSAGNLLMQVEVLGVTEAVGELAFFKADRFGTETSRFIGGAGTSPVVDRIGLVTRFGVPPVPAVPEPATWAMMLIGFGIAGAAMRRHGGGVRSELRPKSHGFSQIGSRSVA